MATNPRDQFIELRKSGVDAVTARKKAYWDITPPTTAVANVWNAVQNAPVEVPAPVTQSTPPPVNVNEQQRIDNQAKRQEMIAQRQVPAVWQPAPPTPPTPAPVTTHPVSPTAQPPAPTTPVPPSTEPTPVNAEIKAKNEAQMALNKQQAELRDQERQKIAQETAQANTPKSASEMYNLISSKQPVPIELQNTSAYRIANNRYQRVNQFVNMTPSEVNQAFTSGKLVEGSQLFEDLKAVNPKLAQDAINLRKVNGNKTNIFTYVNNPDGTKVKVNNLENQFVEQYSEDHPDIIELIKSTFNTPTYAEMQAQINTPEVKAAQEKATAIETEMNNLQTAMEAVDKDVDKELAWTGATGSRIALEKASRKQELQKQYDAKLRDYTTQYNKATSLINQNTEMFKYTQEQKKAMQSALSNVYMKQYESDLALRQNQAEFDQKIKQQAQAMNDPVMAISSMIEEYKKLGIPFTRSTQQIIQDFESSGQDLATYLTWLQKTIQSKPEYQAMQARKAWEGVSYQTFGDSVYRVNADGSLTKTDISAKSAKSTQDWSKLDDTTLFNQRTGEIKKVSPTEASAYWPSSVEVSPEAIKAISNRLSWDNVQCGMVSNDWMAQKFPWAKRMGDSYESKVASVESIGVSDVPQVGGVFAMNTYNSNGHTGIVQSVDLANGTFTATDANKAGKASGWPVTTSTYKISDNFTFSKWPSGVWQARPADIEYFNSATATDKKKLQSNPQYQSFQESKNAVMTDPNADIYDVMKYSQWGKDMWEERLKSLGKFSQWLSQVAELSKKVQEIETWPIIWRLRSYNPYDANAQALIAEINSVVPNIARWVYWEVWVLTDSDIQNYAKTLPNIKSTEDTNKLVLAMTLKTMLNGFKWQIQIDGSAGRDVSGFAWTVKQYEDRINQLLSQIGGNVNSTPQTDPDFDALYNSL